MYEKRSDRKIVILASVLVFAVLAGVFFLVIRPAATGYVVYQEIRASNQSIDDYSKGIAELKSLLEKSDTELSACNQDNSEFFRKLDELVAKMSDCEKSRGVLESQLSAEKAKYDLKISSLESDLKRVEDELKTLKSDRNQLSVQQQKDYDVLAQNLANNICCKEKVDNPDISHYRVENHKIICLEDGSLAISCP